MLSLNSLWKKNQVCWSIIASTDNAINVITISDVDTIASGTKPVSNLRAFTMTGGTRVAKTTAADSKVAKIMITNSTAAGAGAVEILIAVSVTTDTVDEILIARMQQLVEPQCLQT